MHKDEDERLARAIHIMHIEWIKVGEVELNSSTGKYEVTCELKQAPKGPFHGRESWKPLLIASPRQWIQLLTQHGGGLELP